MSIEKKEIEITINEDGSVEFDQIGYKDSSCSGDIDSLLKAIGKEVSNKKKPEFYKKSKIKIKRKL